MSVGLNTVTAQSRLADRLWEQHGDALQAMTEEELAGFAADQLAPLAPTVTDLQCVVQRLQQHQRDNARPADTPERSSDPFERLFG